MNLIEEFCRKAAKDQLSGVIAIALLLVGAVICLVAQVSVPSLNFALPQAKLGFALLAVAIIFILFAFVAFKSSRPQEPVAAAPADSPEVGLASFVVDRSPESIRIRVSGDGEGMSFWKLDDAGELRAWLDVVNFTPTSVKIDRILGDILVCGTVVASFSYFKKETVAPIAYSRLYLQADFTPQHLKNIEFQLQNEREPSSGLNLTVYLIADKGEIELHPRLTTGNNRFVNFPRKPHA